MLDVAKQNYKKEQEEVARFLKAFDVFDTFNY